MLRGRVKALSPTFGFILNDATALDFFFHRDDVVGALDFEQLTVGDSVTFEAVDPVPAKGRRAQKVAWQAGGDEARVMARRAAPTRNNTRSKRRRM